MKRRVVLAMLGLLVAVPTASAGDGKPPPGTPIMWLHISTRAVHVDLKVVEGDPPGNEDGYYPTHYRSTNWPIWGQTVIISAHHYTHALPGHDGGPFRHADQLHSPNVISLTMLSPYGAGTTKYVVTGQKVVNCQGDKINCWPIRKYWGKMSLNRLILTTCIGDGSKRRVIYAYEEAPPLRG